MSVLTPVRREYRRKNPKFKCQEELAEVKRGLQRQAERSQGRTIPFVFCVLRVNPKGHQIAVDC